MPSLSTTAYGAAFLRAAENLLPEDKRLFEDPYSEEIMPELYVSQRLTACYLLPGF